MAKRRIATLPDGTGRFTIIFDDGTTLTVDSSGNIVGQDDSPNPLRAAAFRSGSSDDEAAQARIAETTSAENARRFNETLSQQSKSARQQYEVNMRNARTNQEQAAAEAEYKRAQTELAKQRLAFDERSFNTKTGYDLISTLANLEGPANFFKASDYSRGVSQMPETATFLSALQRNTQMPGFGAQGGVPEAESYSTLMAKLGGGGAAGGGTGGATGWTPDQNNLASIAGIGAAGAHKLGPGALEQLTGTEQKLFMAGLGESGFDGSTFLDQYRRSRTANRYGNVA